MLRRLRRQGLFSAILTAFMLVSFVAPFVLHTCVMAGQAERLSLACPHEHAERPSSDEQPCHDAPEDAATERMECCRGDVTSSIDDAYIVDRVEVPRLLSIVLDTIDESALQAGFSHLPHAALHDAHSPASPGIPVLFRSLLL